MKKFLVIVLSCLTFFSFASNPHIVNVDVNVKNSTVKWIGSKITSSHEGNVSIEKGALAIDHGKLNGGSFTINMNSITCSDIESAKKNKYLVDHLKNEDFFNVKDFPFANINITQVLKVKGNTYKIYADLTIKGITHPIIFQADVDINGLNYSARAKIIIDRTKWNIVYKSGSIFKDLGDKFIYDEIEFEIFLLSVK
tara:strand:- start:2489 stop:3079 length:591 start_codon:yes stop_codon:yes gene_type:complete